MQKTFSPVRPDQMATLRTQLADNGVTVPIGNSGQITGHGITMDFAYDGATVLSLTIVSKPWYVPESMVWDQVQSHLS